MTWTCPAGHRSTTSDWCDTCGAAIGAAIGAAPPDAADAADAADAPRAPQAPSAPDALAAPGGPVLTAGTGPVTGDRCPECNMPRPPDGLFCEVCGLDFVTGTRPPPPPPPAPAPVPDEQAAPAGPGTGWAAVVEVDAAFFVTHQADDPTTPLRLPEGTPPRSIPLHSDEVVIGRGADPSGARPAIDLSLAPADPGVSHRHATLCRRGDAWVVVDRGSTNGTRVGADTAPITPGEEVPLAEGDHLLVGVWTRIRLERTGGAATGGSP
jgi:hypothetical protein